MAEAAMRGDLGRVRELLERGADPNEAQPDGMSGLHWAAQRGDAAMADLLLDAGASVAAVTRLGSYTPLHLAAEGGYGAVVEQLLEAGADPAARTSTGGATALHLAAGAGSGEAVTALLDAGADPDVRETVWSQTPLMFAAAEGRTAAVRALLRGGADASLTARALDMPARDQEDERDEERRNARLEALAAGSPAPEDRPAQPGAQAAPSLPATAELSEGQRDRVPQPLSHAQLIGGYGGLTALLLAVRDGHTTTAAALLDGGADIDQKGAGDGTTPLLMALVNGHFDLAMDLLERGADPGLASDAGATPLYAVINTQWIPKSRHPQPAYRLQQRASHLEVVEALLEAGADPNARLEKQLWFTTMGDDYLGVDRMGATPFWRAAYALDVEAMRLLVAHGADPEIPTLKPAERRRRGGRGGGEDGPDPSGLPPIPPGGPGAWPIHAASGIGYGEGYAANIHEHVPDGWLPAVRYLVEELGADVNARDLNGYTAVHHAAARGDNELILYLVEKGADVTLVSRRGQTTVDMANSPTQRISPFPETIALLESLGAKNNHNCTVC